MQTRSSLRNVLLASTALVAACSSDSEPEPSTIFVGQMATSTSIAVIEGADGTMVVYLCDGAQNSTWFFGVKTRDGIEAASDDGGSVFAKIEGNQITGQVQLSGQVGSTAFTASRASGVAGIYLVEQTATNAHGFSAAGGELDAQISGMTVSGTVRPLDGNALALAGNVKSFGEASGVATWIVQADGRVSGKVTNTAGGGNCSVWSKIKQIAFGVDCSFF